MYQEIATRILRSSTGAFDFDIDALNSIQLVTRWRLVTMLKKLAVEHDLKITFTDFSGKHYHLEWESSEIPTIEFRYPHDSQK
jgi:hypothetical protein